MIGSAKFTVSLPTSIIAQIRRVAKQEDRPASVIVRRALEGYFKRGGKESKSLR